MIKQMTLYPAMKFNFEAENEEEMDHVSSYKQTQSDLLELGLTNGFPLYFTYFLFIILG